MISDKYSGISHQWRSYIGAFRAHALPNFQGPLPNFQGPLPLSDIILAESGKRLIVLSEQFSL